MSTKTLFDPSHPDRYFALMDADTAAMFALQGEGLVMGANLPEEFKKGVLATMRFAIDNRRNMGFAVDPTIIEEVTGLVVSNLAGNDHVVYGSMANGLHRYVIGMAQTNPDALNQARIAITEGAK